MSASSTVSAAVSGVPLPGLVNMADLHRERERETTTRHGPKVEAKMKSAMVITKSDLKRDKTSNGDRSPIMNGCLRVLIVCSFTFL